jgi:hypothetical protein
LVSIDWATDAIASDPIWLALPRQTPPDLSAVATRAIEESGRSPETVDTSGVVAAIYKVFTAQLLAYFKSSGIVDTQGDLDKIFARSDFTQDMLWAYLTHQGAPGWAAYELLSELFAGDAFITDVLVVFIRSGRVDIVQSH